MFTRAPKSDELYAGSRGARRTVCTRARKQAGFTLTELIVAVSVAGVLLGLAIPSYTAFTKNSNMITSANALLSDLQYARNAAITRNQRVEVCPSSTGSDCDSTNWADGWIVFVDQNGDLTFDAGEPIERIGRKLTALSLASVTTTFTASLTYRPNGRAMGATIPQNFGGFLMCDSRGGSFARGILIDRAGRPRVSWLAKVLPMPPTCPTVT